MRIHNTLLASALMIAPLHAMAGSADYVYTPIVEQGEKEIDYKAGSANVDSGPNQFAHSIGFGYGATQYWFTEFYAKYKNEGDGHYFDAWEWENKFQLTQTGQFPIDVGLLVEIERPQDRSEGWEVKWGPLFQTESGKMQYNLNLLFERHYRVDFNSDSEMAYQWQVKYRMQPAFEFGLQGFGELGVWNNWSSSDEQSHSAGPAVFGKIAVAEKQNIKYNAALLFGLNEGAPNSTVRMQVEYEF